MAKDWLGVNIKKETNIFGNSLKKENKRRPIDKNIRSLVWQKCNGNSLSGNCYVCNRPITHDNFHIGHNKAIAKGGKDNVENLRPICAPCNYGMKTMSIEQYKAKHFGGKKPIQRKSKKKNLKRKIQKKEENPLGNLFQLPKSSKKKNPFDFF